MLNNPNGHMPHTNDEILHVDIVYNTAALYRYFITLQRELLEDTPATYIEEFKRKYEYFEGNSIRDLKTFLDSKGIKSQPRTDVIAYPDPLHPTIMPIVAQLQEAELEPGLITFFKQNAGEDVPLHGDYPYRKNCLLMLPIFYNEYEPTEAVTYYQDGGSYSITTPVIMNVMKRHGVKNINRDRLMLHIELPDLTFEELREHYGYS